MRKKSVDIFLILAAVCLFIAQPVKDGAQALDLSVPFNAFLATWIDLIFYILVVIFVALGLSNLDL